MRATRECLIWAATYLALVRAFVSEELACGRDGSAVAESATYERFVGNRIAPDRRGMIIGHRGVVEKIVQEEMLRGRKGDYDAQIESMVLSRLVSGRRSNNRFCVL